MYYFSEQPPEYRPDLDNDDDGVSIQSSVNKELKDLDKTPDQIKRRRH
jgi:hypothetical protein